MEPQFSVSFHANSIWLFRLYKYCIIYLATTFLDSMPLIYRSYSLYALLTVLTFLLGQYNCQRKCKLHPPFALFWDWSSRKSQPSSCPQKKRLVRRISHLCVYVRLVKRKRKYVQCPFPFTLCPVQSYECFYNDYQALYHICSHTSNCFVHRSTPIAIQIL